MSFALLSFSNLSSPVGYGYISSMTPCGLLPAALSLSHFSSLDSLTVRRYIYCLTAPVSAHKYPHFWPHWRSGNGPISPICFFCVLVSRPRPTWRSLFLTRVLYLNLLAQLIKTTAPSFTNLSHDSYISRYCRPPTPIARYASPCPKHSSFPCPLPFKYSTARSQVL